MESEWGYQITKNAKADLDSIFGYIAVELANPKAAFNDVYDLNTDFYAVEMSKTPAYIFLRKIYGNNKVFFKFYNLIAKLFLKFKN